MSQDRIDLLLQKLVQLEQLNETVKIRQTQEELRRLQEEQTELAEENLRLAKLPKAQKSDRVAPNKNEPVYQGKSVRYWLRLLADSDYDVASSGMDALNTIGSPAIPYIVEASLTGNETVLGKVGVMWVTFFISNPNAGPVALPHFVSAIKHSNPSLRNWAVKGLGGIGPAALSALPLIKIAIKDPDPSTSYSAVSAMGCVGRSAAVPTLIKVMNHQKLRTFAVLALKQLETAASSAVPALLEHLNDDDEIFQQFVVEALEVIDPQALARSQQAPFWGYVRRLFGGS